jgi:predicted nuclease of predicted toxin-antitoxin system
VKLVVDMNLSPKWVAFLAANGFESVHWSTVGDPRATDATIMSWAVERGYVVFTHDLDFTTVIALAGATGPSVIQVRTQNVLPESMGANVVQVVDAHADAIAAGAIVTIDEVGARVRVLPIRVPLTR